MCEEEKPPCKHVTTLHTYKTECNADSVEWCPHEPHQNVFVCGNYQLETDSNGKQKRVGRILLFSVTKDILKLLQTIYTSAVLDQKWCHNQVDNHSVLAVANAQKTIEIYTLNSELVQLELLTSYQLEDEEGENLMLSLDWSTGIYESQEPKIVCSDSKGYIHWFKFQNKELVKEGSWGRHQFQAWITAFYYWDQNIFFSGADDCVFLKFDTRVGLEPVARNKSHEAGVTAMHSNSRKEHLLATGSYDSYIRLWDIRFMKNCTTSIKMPGTLWRLKWDPFHHQYLLAACMYDGVHIVDTNTDQLEIIDSYYKHDNISYGADWCFTPPDPHGEVTIATCSFYDNLLCVSKARLSQ